MRVRKDRILSFVAMVVFFVFISMQPVLHGYYSGRSIEREKNNVLSSRDHEVSVANPVERSLKITTPLHHEEVALQVPQGYVLTLKFTGQQVAGLRGIFSQQCWLDSFQLPMTIVEPFMEKSLIIHSVDMWERETEKKSKSLRLSHFYKVPKGKRNVSATSWDAFLNAGHRDVILLIVENIYAKKCLEFHSSSCSHEQRSSLDNSLESTECRFLPYIKKPVEYLEKMGFKVVRKVCLDCSNGRLEGVTPDDVLTHIFGNYKPEKVTLLINQWKFSFRMSPKCASTKTYCANLNQSFKNLQPSSTLSEDADRYFKLIDSLQNNAGKDITTIAVMVRLEWFVIAHKLKSLEKVQSCLKSVRAISHKLSARYSDTRIIVAMDVGKYGSGSFNVTKRLNDINSEYFNKLFSEVKTFIQQMYGGKLTFDSWEESFVTASRGNDDRGYIAALQSMVVSKADCLVLMGGGHFQELAHQQYVSRKPQEECVHLVCVPSEQSV